jgi:hypothetical protein
VADLLATGSAWLADQLKKHASTRVYYKRAAAAVQLSATIGRSEFDGTDTDGHLLRFQSRDYLVDAQDLVIDDVPTEPKPGDQIIEGDLDNGFVYEVMPVGEEGCWRWADSFRIKYRIHTKYVGTQP